MGFQPTYEELKPISGLVYFKRSIVFSLPMRNWNYRKHRSEAGVYSVFSLPMRNWNPFSILYKKNKGEVFSLPMRNWNFCTKTIPKEWFLVFSLPMRNWNPFQCCQRVPDLLFSAYLWGIETTGYTFSVPAYPVFSAYLWGIETVQPAAGGWFTFLFSAYLWGIETQKLESAGLREYAFSAYLWGIETLEVNSAWFIKYYRFQPTYEELKQRAHMLIDCILGVFSLPMRNWNGAKRKKCMPVLEFSAYLWGIETECAR